MDTVDTGNWGKGLLEEDCALLSVLPPSTIQATLRSLCVAPMDFYVGIPSNGPLVNLFLCVVVYSNKIGAKGSFIFALFRARCKITI